jgi:[ribosomal protein S5]-alanine N-acetyltransferase
MDKKNYYIDGNQISLRGIKISDVNDTYCKWMNDPEITAFLESRFQSYSIKDLKKYVENKINSSNNLFLAIILKKDDRHIGNIKLSDINWYHKYCDIGIIIGEKDCWGKGYAFEAIKLLTDFAFSELKLHKITAGAYDVNESSVRAFLKAGYFIEGKRKKHFLFENRYVNAVQMAIINE